MTFKHFFYCLLFLTKTPIPFMKNGSDEDWGKITPYFTLVGYVIGIVLFLISKILNIINLPITINAFLILFFWILITGGLHLDGLMDTWDGINCQDKNRKIDAMRDSRVGAFGAIAGIMLILFKYILILELLSQNFFNIIIFIPTIARLIPIYCFTFLEKNLKSGTSSSLISNGINKPIDFILNLLILFLPVFIFFSLKIFIFLILGIIFSLFWAHWLDAHFSGHTGDTFGAAVELSEVTGLLLWIIFKNNFFYIFI